MPKQPTQSGRIKEDLIGILLAVGFIVISITAMAHEELVPKVLGFVIGVGALHMGLSFVKDLWHIYHSKRS